MNEINDLKLLDGEVIGFVELLSDKGKDQLLSLVLLHPDYIPKIQSAVKQMNSLMFPSDYGYDFEDYY